MKLNQTEKKILGDNRSGSSEILQNAVQYNLNFLKGRQITQSAVAHLIQFDHAVINHFAGMTMVRKGVEYVLILLSRFDSKYDDPRAVIKNILGLNRKIQTAENNIIKNCREIFQRRITVITYSNSGLVKKVLHHYRSKLMTVIISEARPAREGRVMAQFLAKSGIDVVYCVDILLPDLMKNADYFIIGADSVGPKYFINKIGTAVLLKCARNTRVKSLVLFESLKASDEKVGAQTIANRTPDEIWEGKSFKGIEVINRYLEKIPNKSVNTFISDQGVYRPASLARKLKAGQS